MKTDGERFETVVIGGGQAGLAVGYHLAKQQRPFVILDASEHIGDSWRNRWESLRLFTPSRYNGLPGMRFPGPGWSFPTRDEMADFLTAYAARFELPVRSGARVDRLSRDRDSRLFVVTAGERRFDAKHVIVAMANYQSPRVPEFAQELDPSIVQLHSGDYRNPSQLREGGVLLVGAGNSGAEIALEVVRTHATWLSGRDTGHVPVRIEGLASRLIFSRIVLRLFFHRILTVRTPLGQKLWRKARSKGQPLIRVKPKDLAAAGVVRVPRATGVRGGLPVLEDGRVVEVTNVAGVPGSIPASRGSTSLCSRTESRCTSAGSFGPSPDST